MVERSADTSRCGELLFWESSASSLNGTCHAAAAEEVALDAVPAGEASNAPNEEADGTYCD